MGIIRIPLSCGKFAIADDTDAELLSRYNWHASRRNGHIYAVTKLPTVENGEYRQEQVGMHRMLMGAHPGEFVDHVDGDGLNNRRYNLRICTPQENARNSARYRNNTSGYKGVKQRKDRRNRLWRAVINVNSKRIHLGYFQTAEEAARAYDAAAREHFGEFARLNFPLADTGSSGDGLGSVVVLPTGTSIQKALAGVTIGDNPSPQTIPDDRWGWLCSHINDRTRFVDLARQFGCGKETVRAAVYNTAVEAGLLDKSWQVKR